MLIKELVRQFREQKGWKQIDLAQRLKVSQNYVSKIELGLALPRSPQFKQKLGKILGISERLLLEAYAESKLAPKELSAFEKRLKRTLEFQQKSAELTAPEQEMLSRFSSLSKRDQNEVIDFINFKSGAKSPEGPR